jgi:hypothetical protein
MKCNWKGAAAVAALAIGIVASQPGYAGSLGGAVSGAVGGVTGAASGVTGAVGNAAGGLTGAGSPGVGPGTTGLGNLDTKAQVNLFGPKGAVSVKAKSKLLNGINAQLRVLNKQELVKVCANVGGGTGCGSGSTNQLLNLITERIRLLSPTALANLCLSIGGSCGGDGGGVAGGGGGGSGGGHGGGGVTLSSGEQAHMRKGCLAILAAPQDYDSQLVRVCRTVPRM